MDTITLRDYQLSATNAVQEKWTTNRSTVVVLPTGCGKTVVFGAIAKNRLKELPAQKIMILAHREELVSQAKEKVSAITGRDCDVEMGFMKTSTLFKMDIVVSSIQTQITGRMKKFDPMEFSTLIIDEAHHATAKSYRKVIEYYARNPELKILGVTATPDRADSKALGQVFDDANDVVTDIFLKREPEEWTKVLPQEREILIMHRIRSRIKNAAHKHWAKQEKVFTTGLSIDQAPTGDYSEDGDEENIESALLSDEGRGAFTARSFESPGPLPSFRYGVLEEVKKLRGLTGKVARAILRERTITCAIKKTKLYTRLFYAILKNLKSRFTQCLLGRNEYYRHLA